MATALLGWQTTLIWQPRRYGKLLFGETENDYEGWEAKQENAGGLSKSRLGTSSGL